MPCACRGLGCDKFYQKWVGKSFNRKVQVRHFEINDLVFRKVLLIISEPREKFTRNYDGPYIVKNVLPSRALILVEMDGHELPKPVNANTVKKHFP